MPRALDAQRSGLRVQGSAEQVSAALRQAFTQLDHQNATQTMRHVADQLRDKWPKLGAFIDDSEADVLA